MLKSILLIGVLAVGVMGQSVVTHTMRGTVKDPSGAVISGVVLQSGKVWSSTDVNGEFAITLPVGDHLLTIDPPDLYPLQAHIKITTTGPNPDNVHFTVDPSKKCCRYSNGRAFPKPIDLPEPKYPPAALATRAEGRVEVDVMLNADGTVTVATVLNGHPLLRKAAEAAAKASRFEPAIALDPYPLDEKIRLTYFFSGGGAEKPNVRRFKYPFSVYIIAPASVIDISEN